MIRALALSFSIILLASCSSGGRSCSANSDCAGTASGRSCVPTESWCDYGSCQSACRQLCTTLESDVNTCPAPTICNDDGKGMRNGYPPYCTGAAVPCADATDCPLYRPVGADGGQSQWTCADGACQYPGIQYIQGNP